METTRPERGPAPARVGPSLVERQRAQRRGTEKYVHLATAIDLLHMPLVIALIVFGLTWFSTPVFVAVVTVVVVLQVAMLGCPFMLVSGWLRRKHDPDHETRWSLTVWLYRRYGAAVGVGVFLFFLAAALAARALLF